jgi:hypothetical protein
VYSYFDQALVQGSLYNATRKSAPKHFGKEGNYIKSHPNLKALGEDR